jgi:ubiquinone/menaquinone biosynthesis C-methylase UbiE
MLVRRISLRLMCGQRVGMRTDYHAPFARRYAKSRGLSRLAQQVWSAELVRAADGICVSKVADLGAGAGRFWPVFRTAWQPDIILAIDKSPAMLGQSEDHIGVLRVVGDVDALPLANSTVDLCFCSMILHYSADPSKVLSRLQEVLRPGGTVCIRTGTTATLGSFDFLRHFPTAKRAELFAMPNRADVEFWLKSAGFEHIDIRTVEVQSHESRWTQLSKVWNRGFPSLQLVPRREFVLGILGYAVRLYWDAVRHEPITSEATLLATGRRS